jgi:hypothetical protein
MTDNTGESPRPQDFVIEVIRDGACSVRVTHTPTGLTAHRDHVLSQIRGRDECIAEICQHLKNIDGDGT